MTMHRIFALLTFGGIFVTSTVAFGAVKDACSLITAADAQTVLGESVGEPQPSGASGAESEGSACKFKSTQSRSKSLSLTVEYSHEDLSGKMGAMAENLKQAGFKNVHNVGGAGDEAIWATNTIFGRAMDELTVRKGKQILLIILVDGISDEAAALDRAKALANVALHRT
jgi:hypothetical protein